MTNELIILGLLKDGPKHGYQIKRIMEKVLSTLYSTSPTPTYYTLKKLEKEDYLTKSIERAGNRPQRQIYHITPAGEARLQELLKRNITILERPHYNLDTSLFFLNYLNPTETIAALKESIKHLSHYRKWAERIKRTLEQNQRPFYIVAIAEHNLARLNTEIEFLEKFLHTYREKAEFPLAETLKL
jgi:DNA-binding PadR family transcriptional regulator